MASAKELVVFCHGENQVSQAVQFHSIYTHSSGVAWRLNLSRAALPSMCLLAHLGTGFLQYQHLFQVEFVNVSERDLLVDACSYSCQQDTDAFWNLVYL